MRQKRKNYSYFKRKISDFVYLCIEHIKLAPIRGQFLLIRKYFCPTSGGSMCLRHNGKAFTRRSELDSQELRKLQILSKTVQRQMHSGCVYPHSLLWVWHIAYSEMSNICIGDSIFISAWASTLFVSTRWAMRRPLRVGRTTGKVPTLFCFGGARIII